MRKRTLLLFVATLSMAGLLMKPLLVLADFDFLAFQKLGPSTLDKTAPLPLVSYVEDTDFSVMAHSEPGTATAPVTAVDLALYLGNTSTSGCETSDFSGFPAGNIALIQRGTCLFRHKAENAANADAVGVIILNQGNTEDRKGIFFGTLLPSYAGGIPVFGATYDRGVEWASTSGLVVQMDADVFRGQMTLEEFTDFIDDAVDDGTIVGSGPGNSGVGRLNALRNKIDEGIALAEAGDIGGACNKFENALDRVDGVPKPPDFATGDAADDLRGLLQDLISSLSCGS
jgi:hypothetical protein